jgi:hypothetical protein
MRARWRGRAIYRATLGDANASSDDAVLGGAEFGY